MTNNTEKSKKLEQAFALWKHKAKSGSAYFTGGTRENPIIAYYNTKKKNPKEPDLRVYKLIENEIGDEICSLWVNSNDNGKQWLTGKFNDKKVVGFIYKGDNEKRPYISVYYQEDKKETAVGENFTVIFDGIPAKSEETPLPF